MRPNIEYIKSEMKKRNWSGSMLAMKMGVSRMEVSRVLRGENNRRQEMHCWPYKAFPELLSTRSFFGLSGTYKF